MRRLAIALTVLALLALLGYSLERSAWLFGLFERWSALAIAAAVVVELAAVALIVGAGALAHIDPSARAWANRALVAVLSVQALANLSAGYLRGGAATLVLFGVGSRAAYVVAAVLWLVTNLAVPALVLCLSKLLERLLSAPAASAAQPTQQSVVEPAAAVVPLPVPMPIVKEPLPGFIYLLRAVGGEQYKIGRANDVAARIRRIAGFVPFPVEIAHTIETDDMVRLEHCLHFVYDTAGKRINGEWFRLTQQDVSCLQGIGEQLNSDTFDDTLDALSLVACPPAETLDTSDDVSPLDVARSLRQKGLSWRQVARRVGMSDATLRRRLAHDEEETEI